MIAVATSRQRLGLTDPLRRTLDSLHERWSEPHRSYHALSHLDAALGHVEEFDLHEVPEDRTIIEWALWFHDAIYDATATDNEERSAVLAERQLLGHLPEAGVAEIARLVRLTAGHVVEPADRLGGVMIDIDLSILGSSTETYDRYTAGVRSEYRHRSDDDFRAGRAQFLTGMLARDQIFNTSRGTELWEASARRNMAAELASLS